MAGTDFRAVLTADCGIEYTRVTLVDIVGESEYRLVAQSELPSTVEPPLSDVTLAVQQGIADLERSTGRQLLEGGQLRIPQGRDGQGVDAFVATCSAGGSLPVLVLAVTADITARSATRAVEGTYAVPFRVVTMDEILKNPPLGGEAAVAAQSPWWKVVEALHPGGVLLVGGVDGGNIAPLRTLARSLAEALPPRATSMEQEVAGALLPVIYAGNRRAQETVHHDLAGRVALHLVDNVRPTMREEQLLPARQEVTRLYDEQVLQRVAGYEALSTLAQSPVQLPYMGLQLATRFIAVQHQRQVLMLDLGSAATTAVWAEGEQCVRVVLGNFGLGYGIGRVLAERGVERIRRWLPFPASEEEIRDWVLNRALRPHTVSTTAYDFLLQQAVAREALITAVEHLQEQVPARYEMLVASGGGLARAPRLAQSVLTLLDALQPTAEDASGLMDLYLDRYCLIPSVGALATLNPDAAACVLMKDALSLLGPCLVPLGRPRKGAHALKLELQYANEVRQEVEVRWGEIGIVPFQWGEEAHLTVRPARGVRLGLGRPGESQSTKNGDMIRGGSLGLIVDARGRPLDLPAGEEERMSQLRDWLIQAGAYSAEELASVLPPPPPPPVEAEPAPEEPAVESTEPSTSA